MEKTFAELAIALLIGVIAYPVIASNDNPRINKHMMHVYDDIPTEYIYPSYDDKASSSGQDEKLASLYSKFENDSKKLKDELLAKNEEFHNLMAPGQRPDIDDIQSIRKEISDIWTKLTQMSIDLQFEEQKIDPDANY